MYPVLSDKNKRQELFNLNSILYSKDNIEEKINSLEKTSYVFKSYNSTINKIKFLYTILNNNKIELFNLKIDNDTYILSEDNYKISEALFRTKAKINTIKDFIKLIVQIYKNILSSNFINTKETRKFNKRIYEYTMNDEYIKNTIINLIKLSIINEDNINKYNKTLFEKYDVLNMININKIKINEYSNLFDNDNNDSDNESDDDDFDDDKHFKDVALFFKNDMKNRLNKNNKLNENDKLFLICKYKNYSDPKIKNIIKIKYEKYYKLLFSDNEYDNNYNNDNDDDENEDNDDNNN